MDYSKIHIAKRVLEAAGIEIPESEEEIRRQAYEKLTQRDFLAAHSIRLGKNYRDFTKQEWSEVIQISGIEAVNSNMAAFAICMHHGLI